MIHLFDLANMNFFSIILQATPQSMNFCLEELDPTLVVEIEVGDLCSKIIQKSK